MCGLCGRIMVYWRGVIVYTVCTEFDVAHVKLGEYGVQLQVWFQWSDCRHMHGMCGWEVQKYYWKWIVCGLCGWDVQTYYWKWIVCELSDWTIFVSSCS